MRKINLIDIVLILLIILIALPSLSYPYGGDQSIFGYIARYWARGFIPYRDIFDHKPPGIYVTYLLVNSIFCHQDWAIRLVELATTIALYFLFQILARLLNPRSRCRFCGLFFSIFYYFYFEYQNTAQAEMWIGLFILLAIIFLFKYFDHPGKKHYLVLFSIFSCLPVLYKLPAVIVSFLLFLFFVQFEWSLKQRAQVFFRDLLLYLVSFAVFPLIIAAYFIFNQSWNEMYEAIVIYNISYSGIVETLSEGLVISDYGWGNLFAFWRAYLPFTFFALLFFITPDWRSRRGIILLLWLGGSILILVVQKKIIPYHLIVILFPLAALSGISLENIWRQKFRGRVIALLAIGVGCAHLYMAKEMPYVNFYKYLSRQTTSQEYYSGFWDGECSYIKDREMAQYIKDHSRPTDRVAILFGWRPNIYFYCERMAPVRFISMGHVHNHKLKTRDWLVESARKLNDQMPPFVLLNTNERWMKEKYDLIKSIGGLYLYRKNEKL